MSNLFSSPAPLPAPQEPTPLPDDEQLTRARRRRIAKDRGASSSMNTILSDGGRETLGG